MPTKLLARAEHLLSVQFVCSLKGFTGEPVIGRLATAGIDGLENQGPFLSAAAYFRAVENAAVRKVKASTDESPSWAEIGAFVFHDMVHHTAKYQSSPSTAELFPLNHIDLGTQTS